MGYPQVVSGWEGKKDEGREETHEAVKDYWKAIIIIDWIQLRVHSLFYNVL